MHITEEFLREAIQTVRNVMGYDTGTYSDSQIMTMKGPVVGALVQARVALWIQENDFARRP
jgi:hypothetical protein